MESPDGSWSDSTIARTYGAALAVSSNPTVAEHVTAAALEAGAGSEREVVNSAMRLAARAAPAHPYSLMSVGQREAVALARPGGSKVGEIADTLGISPQEAKRRMLEGLMAAAAPAPAQVR
jgi:hypothetical protein